MPLRHLLYAQSDTNSASSWFDEGKTTLKYENLSLDYPTDLSPKIEEQTKSNEYTRLLPKHV